MKLILERKVNNGLLYFLLYLSFCISMFYFSRGELGYALMTMASAYQSVLMANSITAFFFGGLIPFAFYLILTSFSFKLLYRRLGPDAISMRYTLHFFYIGANVVTGLVSFFYLISPIVSIYGGVLIPFLSALVFFVLYLKFSLCHYVKKSMRGAVVLLLSGFFALTYAFITIANLGVL